MSLINTEEDQRWVPTHVQVTVLRGRGLRAKGKSGTSDVYTIIQVGKEKYCTCVVEKTTAPEWKEECAFELLPGVLEAGGRSAYPAGSCDLVLTVMHRALIGLDVFLGQAIIPLDTVFQERLCTRNEWYKLNSKTGKKQKERGEVQATVQFTRNNLTASMYDLSAKDKPFSAFGRLKDRMKGKKREDVESASAIVPGGFGAQGRRRTRLPSDGGGEEDYEDDEGGEVRRSKMRNFFLRGKLRKSSDTRSSTSLGSESSESSSRGGSLSPTAGISVVVSDLSNSPSETSNLTADNSPEHTAYPSPRLSSHKRAFSDEVGLISLAPPLPPPPPPPQPRAVESLKREGVLSQSEGDPSRSGSVQTPLTQPSLCVNGSHVYGPPLPPPAAPAPLGLLQKCAPLSRSLQNLARRPDDSPRLPPASEARRWSFDKAAKEEKAGDLAVALQPPEQKPTLAAALVVPAAAVVAEAGETVAEGKRQKRNLFSSGKGAEPGQAPPSSEEGGKLKGWFSSKDPHNKPSPEVSPKVDPSTGAAPSPSLTPSPHNPTHVPLSASAAELVSPGVVHHSNPFAPLPCTPNISPCNPFFTRMQCNPFFVELLGDHALKSASPAPSLSSSILWPTAAPSSSSWSDLNPADNYSKMEPDLVVGLAQQKPHLGGLGTKARASPNPFIDSPMSENLNSEWDESFEAFAASRLGSLRGSASLRNLKSLLKPEASQALEGLQTTQKNTEAEKGFPSLLQRRGKIPILQGRQSPRFDWSLEPDLKTDLFPPPQIGVLSAEHSMVDLSGHTPTPSQASKGATSRLWEWDPEKPLDVLLSSPQFVNMSSVIPECASSGQPIGSPFGKDLTETSGRRASVDGFRSLAEEQDPIHSSASVSYALEGIRREGAFTGDIPHLFGDELNNADLPPQIVPEVSTSKPEVSLATPNPFFLPITLPAFSETPLEGLSSTDALKPEYEVASNPMTSNTNVVFRQITTEAGRENLSESHANVFDFANSVLPYTDAHSSLSVTMANNTEIKNNSTHDLFSSPSLFDHEEIMNEKSSKKPGNLFSDILEDSSLADMADQLVKADPPLPFSSEGTLLDSVPDISVNAPELSPEKLDEVPAGSPVQVDKKDKVLLEGDGLKHEEPCAEILRKEGSDSLPGGKETVSPKPSVVSLTEETSGILNEDAFAPDALGTDSDYKALDADQKDAHLEICEEENANLSVKESSGGSTLSDYLEARDPGPSISPVADAMDFITAIEDPDPGSIWESHDAPSPELELNRLPLQGRFDEMAAPVEAGEITPSPFGAEDPSSDAVEQGVQPENLLSDFDSSKPPSAPPRLFQDSVFDELHMNESHQPNLGEEHSDTPRDSPADRFQTPEVGSGPESQQASSFPLGTTAAPGDRWQKIGSEIPKTTYPLTEDDLSTHKPEVSLAEPNQFFVPITLPSFSETPLEGLSSTDALKPEYELTSNPMTSTTNVDFPPVMTEAGHENVCESLANVFDFANSGLPNTAAASSLSLTMANNNEINSNSTNDLFTSPSLFDHEEIMNEKNSKKPDDLFSDILEDSSLADAADQPVKADPPLPFSSEGTLLESMLDISVDAPELPPEKLDEVTAGSPVQVDKKDEVLLEGDGLKHEEPCAEILRKEGSDSLPGGKETVSPKPSVVSLTEETSNGILNEDAFAPDALGTDSDYKALDADQKDAHQEICEEENANLSVKESSGGSTLSDYLEARDPGPSISPVADAMDFITAIEDPDPGSIWESHDAPSPELELNRLPLQSRFDEMAAPVEAGEITPSPFGMEEPSSDAVEQGVQPENLLSDFDSSKPPSAPPRLFQDSVFDELHLNESHRPNLGEEHSDTPRDSPADCFQTPEVGSGPESQQASSFPLGTTVAPEDRWQKIGPETPNTTYAHILTEDELLTGKQEVPQFDFSAFGIEETSNQSWLTGKDNFKVKELDTTNFAAWSADEELAIQMDSRSLDEAILMETTAESKFAPVLDYGIQPNPTNRFFLPGQNDDDGLWGSYLDPLKVAKPEESVEPTWKSLPCLSELCSTVSQDLVTDMAPEDLRKPKGEEEAQKALSELPVESALFPQSDLFSGTSLSALPMGSDSVSDLLKGNSSEAAPTLWGRPPIGEKPKSSVFLHDCNPQASSTPSLLAETNAQVDFFPSPIQPDPATGATPQASSVNPSSDPPATIDALLMLLPQETRPTTSLPSAEQTSPHPVKPLNATAPQEEKKPEGRSVLASRLEKLKSTIHPGRAAQQGESEANRDEGAASYYQMSHSELITLLLQREAELERQGSEFERQGALLEKREAELRKMKAQTRDLEDYIDRLLVQIMEQKPNLLQVRTKLK